MTERLHPLDRTGLADVPPEWRSVPERAGRVRGGRVLAVLLPGAPQLLAGRIASGLPVLFLWLGALAVIGTRLPVLGAALGGGWDERLAVLVLVVAAGAAWGWSWRDAGRGEGETDGEDGVAGLGRTFVQNRVAVTGLWGVVLVALLAVLAPVLAPFDPVAQGDLLTGRLQGPSSTHLLGTDRYARDVLSRILYGARISLSVGLIAAAVSVGIGAVLGGVAGYLGGAVDSAVMRLVDVVIAFPRLVLLIAVVALFEPSLLLIVAVLGLTQWPHAARIVRGEVLSLREREFVEAGRALGFSRARLLAGHVMPNTLAPIIVAGTLAVGDTIVLEAGLSFLGLGIQPPTPSWGVMVADGRHQLMDAWWITTFPGLAIVFTVLAFNLAGDGLRDALDPRLRR